MTSTNSRHFKKKTAPFCKGLSAKGFLFTISIIIFASTLVIYAQAYLNHSIIIEKYVVDYSNKSIQPFVNDDLAFDLTRILGFSVGVDYNNDMNFVFSDVVPKKFDLNAKLQSYKVFLDANFFPRLPGTNSLDFSGINDGSIELFFGNDFQYTYNYDTNLVTFTQLQGATIKRIDLNLTVDDVNADTALDSNSWSSSGSIPITINYWDDYNTLAITGMINPAAANNLLLTYKDASKLGIAFGLVNGSANSFLIDSNTQNILSYSMRVSYGVADINSMPVAFNVVLRQSNSSFDSNSLLKIKN